VDNAGEQRIPRGGSLQESKFQVWPAAIRPQTPAVPGTKRPPGFGRRGGTPRSPRCGPRTSHPPQASRPRPKGHSELRMASGGREDTGQTQSAAAADVLLRGRLPGPKGVELTHPGKRDDRAGKSSGEYYLASTQTLRRPSGAQISCNPSLSQKLLGGTRFTMAVVRARSFSHTMWAAFLSQDGDLVKFVRKTSRVITWSHVLPLGRVPNPPEGFPPSSLSSSGQEYIVLPLPPPGHIAVRG
jgi:hypothetical protein